MYFVVKGSLLPKGGFSPLRFSKISPVTRFLAAATVGACCLVPKSFRRVPLFHHCLTERAALALVMPVRTRPSRVSPLPSAFLIAFANAPALDLRIYAEILRRARDAISRCWATCSPRARSRFRCARTRTRLR